MAFPDDLPTRTDESIGRTKVNTGTYSNTSTQADAGEYNRLLDNVVGIAASLGRPTGADASSAWQAILGGLGGTQTRTTTGAVSDATGFLAITLSTLPITATVSALTSGSRSLLVYVTGTADPVVATISLTDGTIFGGGGGNLTFEEDGLYWFHGFGGDPTSTWFSRTRLDDIQSETTFQSWVQSFSAGKGFSGGLLNATGPMPDGKVIVVDLTSANITATLPNPPDGHSPWPRELIIIQGAYSLTLNPGASSRINGGALDADYVVPTTTSGIRRVWLTQSGTPGGDDTWYVTSEAKLDEVTATTDALDTRLDAIEANEWVTLVRIAAAVKSAAQNVESLRQIYTSTPAAIGTAAPGSSVLAAAGDHVHAHGSQTDGSHHAAATTSVAGFMSAADKTKIDYFTFGSGSPEGVVTAPVGATYADTTNGIGWRKKTGSGNTGWVQIDRCESGTYTPTFAILGNLDSISANGLTSYIRVGDQVFVSGSCNIDPTASGQITYTISLPIASNFTLTTDASGMNTARTAFIGLISADTTNDVATVQEGNTSTTAGISRFFFSYTVK